MLSGARQFWRYLLKGPLPGEREFIIDLTECTKLIAPEGCEISTDGKRIEIKGPHVTQVFMPSFLLRAELDIEERLRLVTDAYSEKIQSLFSSIGNRPWPALNVDRYINQSGCSVHVMWISNLNLDSVIVTLGPVTWSSPMT